MLVIAVLMQSVWVVVAAAEVKAIVAFGFTVIVPPRLAEEQPPVVVTV